MSTTKTWEEFNRSRQKDFYGCVDRDGFWFDSGFDFPTAVHWCCCAHGHFDLSTEEEMEWMFDYGQEHGLSIIHSTQLKRMYEKGLIK